MTQNVLEVRDLRTSFGQGAGAVTVVHDVAFDLRPGEIVALVGESGSGKSVSALSVIGLLPANSRVTGGEIRLEGTDLRALSRDAMRRLRGRRISMVFQDPRGALNPLHRIATQIIEMLKLQSGEGDFRSRARILLEQVGIVDPEQVLDSYPHQLSGGMCQRVMIAIALACEPKVLIADEPTTALDVTTQAQILDLMQARAAQSGTAILLITHDLGIVARYAHRVNVMHGGRIVERGTVAEVFRNPQQLYTRKLLAAVPRLDRPVTAPARAAPPEGPAGPVPILRVLEAAKTYGAGTARAKRAVDGISFELARGETLALVGESGSGKSTLGRMVLGLESTTDGVIHFGGVPVSARSERMLRPLRSRMQMIFQDPSGSLNPRLTVAQAIEEPLVIHKIGGDRAARRTRVLQLLDMVGIPASAADRYPHEFSGGQRQRIGIARAIAVNPQMIVADEAVSALDVSIQAQIIKLLGELQAELNLAHLFISHDLSVVRQIADRVMVMYRGRMMEIAPTEQLFRNPSHPYTRMLIEAAPIPDPEIEARRRRDFTAGSENDWRAGYDPAAATGMTRIAAGHYVAA